MIAGAGLTALLSLGYVAWVGRELGPETFGQFSTGLAILYFCRIAANPIHATITRLTAEHTGANDLSKIRALARLLSVRSTAFALLAILGIGTWGEPIANLLNFPSTTYLIVIASAAYLTVLCGIPRGILRGLKRFNEYTISTIAEALIRIGSGIILLAWVANATTAFFAFVISLACIYIYISSRTYSLLGYEAEAIAPPPISKIILPLFYLMLASAAIKNADMLVAQANLLPFDAGIYGAAYAFSKICSAIATPFLIMLLPAVVSANTNSHSIKKPLVKACAGYITLSIPPILASLWLPDEIISLLFGGSFISSGPLLFPLVVARTMSHVSHMIVLTSATIGKHTVIWIYIGGLAIELLALAIWNNSPDLIVSVVLIAQSAILLVVTLNIVYNTNLMNRT